MKAKDMTVEIAQRILDTADFRITHTPVYKGNFKIVLYYTNGKDFHVNNVRDYVYTPAKENSPAQFSYTMKDSGNSSFYLKEERDMNMDQLAGFAIRDNTTGGWWVQPLKPCWHEKHSFHMGLEPVVQAAKPKAAAKKKAPAKKAKK